MILTRDGKEIVAIYKQDGDEVDEVKDANGRLVYTNTREITGTLPLSFTSRGKPLTDYRISGNTVQEGTPTPDAPVDVVGCGVRTRNLLPLNLTRYEKAYSPREGIVDYAGGATYLLPIKANTTYTIKIHSDNSIRLLRAGLYNEDTPISGTFVQSLQQIEELPNPTATVKNSNYKYLYVQIIGTYIDQYGLSHVVANEGSTPIPYEPYGYKLPLTVNGTEYPIYLGEAQTTRKIKKLVLTGDEIWAEGSANYYSVIPSKGVPYSNALCTHAKNASSVDNSGNYLYLQKQIFVYETLTDFKSYLAQQYQNGTPVTIWYVLATPKTSVINEPLMKIGDYADTITMAQAGVTIPTINGANTLDMASTIKPSEVYIKGKGIRAIT